VTIVIFVSSEMVYDFDDSSVVSLHQLKCKNVSQTFSDTYWLLWMSMIY